ncbi:hypothetical protein ACIQPR_10780 [Streptomyces sp. NPDC091280]|uniref:hypothetical protein n=1 Tax=Streptomyces sp. NPDC091280 TaxID=3365984 RepID=UPI0038134385
MGLVLARRPRRRVQVARLGPVKLNLDDLQDLQRLLATKTGEPVLVEVGRYDADGIPDLADADDEDLASVVLNIPTKSFTVTLNRDGANVVCDSDERNLIDLVEDVANYVNAKPLSTKIVYPSLFMTLLSVQWAMIVGCSLFLTSPDSRATGYWASGILTATMIWFLFIQPRSWKARGAVEIIPLRRHEIRRRRFDSSNSVWSGVAGAVVGAVLGACATIAAVYLNK